MQNQSQLRDLTNQNTDKTSFSLYDFEDMFLGAIVAGVTDGEEILSKDAKYFIQKDNILVFNAIRHSKEHTGYCDYIAVVSEVAKSIGSAQAKALIDRLIAKVPNEYNPSSAGDKIEEFYIKREANALLDTVKTAIQANPFSASEILLSAAEKLDKVTSKEINFNVEKEFSQTIEALLDGTAERMVIPTGLEFIDSVIGGFATQEVTFIGARPGHGKTTSCVSLAKSILDFNIDKKVVIFELEMSKESLKRKFLSNLGNVSSERIRLNKLNDQDKINLREALNSLSKYKDRLFIYDDVYDISTMNKIMKSTKADIAFVDFINFMEGMQSDDTRREMGRVAMSAKRFAKMHNSAYVFFAQLNRNVEGRDTKRPEAGDLAESDLLTWIGADIILLLYKYKYTRDKVNANQLTFIFDKTRYAEVGDRLAYFSPDTCKLMDMAKTPTNLRTLIK